MEYNFDETDTTGLSFPRCLCSNTDDIKPILFTHTLLKRLTMGQAAQSWGYSQCLFKFDKTFKSFLSLLSHFLPYLFLQYQMIICNPLCRSLYTVFYYGPVHFFHFLVEFRPVSLDSIPFQLSLCDHKSLISAVAGRLWRYICVKCRTSENTSAQAQISLSRKQFRVTRADFNCRAH